MDTIDLTAFLGLVVGATQIIKNEFAKRGMPLGDYARLIAFVLGGLGTYLMAYHKDVWDSVIPVLVMFGGTGGFSVLKELKKS